MKKIFLIVGSLLLLFSCAQTTALLGPAITVGTTGNIMQAGFTYGSNVVVKEATGKSPTEHVTTYVSKKKQEKKSKKIEMEMHSYLENHILLMRAKLHQKN